VKNEITVRGDDDFEGDLPPSFQPLCESETSARTHLFKNKKLVVL